jgi:5'-nucleotidase
MTRGPIDLTAARILVTNDDGIHAPGLKVLERVARSLSHDVWTVAPEVEQSAASHALTTRRPLRIRRFGPRRFAVDGTPTDCVLVALHRVVRGRPPDLVLSGINQGGNLGEDVTYSGTVAAGLEAALLGLPAVAFSQLRAADAPMLWGTGERYAPEVLRALVGITWPPDLLFNVNFPPVPPDKVTGIRACHQGRRQSGVEIIDGEDPGGRPYVWIGDFSSHHSEHPESDLRAVAEGAISVTPLHLDMTHRATLENLSPVLAAGTEGGEERP